MSSLNIKDPWVILTVIQDSIDDEDKEIWVSKSQDELLKTSRSFLNALDEKKANIFTLEAMIAFIQLTAYMNFDTALKVIHLINRAEPDFLGGFLDTSFKHVQKSVGSESPIRGEANVVLQRFKLLISLEIVSGMFLTSRRKRVMRALKKIEEKENG